MKKEDILEVLEKEIEVVSEAKQHNGLSIWAGIAAAVSLLWMSLNGLNVIFWNFGLSIAFFILAISSAKAFFLLTELLIGNDLEKIPSVIPLDSEDLGTTPWMIWATFQEFAVIGIYPAATFLGPLPVWTRWISIPAFLFELFGFIVVLALLRMEKGAFEMNKFAKAALKWMAYVKLVCYIGASCFALSYVIGIGSGFHRIEVAKQVLLLVAAGTLVQIVARMSQFHVTYSKLVGIRRQVLLNEFSSDNVERYLKKLHEIPSFQARINEETIELRSVQLKFGNEVSEAEAKTAKYKKVFGDKGASKVGFTARVRLFESINENMNVGHLLSVKEGELKKTAEERLIKWVRFTPEGRRMVATSLLQITEKQLEDLARFGRVLEFLGPEAKVLFGLGWIPKRQE